MGDSSSDEEINVPDESALVDEKQLEKLFQNKFYLATEQSVSLQTSYILNLSATRNFQQIAASTSKNTVYLYDLSSQNGLSRILFTNNDLTESENKICGIRFANKNNNLLYVCKANGLISSYDLRSGDLSAEYLYISSYASKKKDPLLCFDLNQNDLILCAGTELCPDAVLKFFDVRKPAQSLGQYEVSHSDDICDVKFHPNSPDRLATGSIDGLLNVFDISKTNENDALEYCMNTDDSVDRISWHSNLYGKDQLSAVTHTNFYLYDVEEQDLLIEYNRDVVAEKTKLGKSENCNIISSHSMMDKNVLVLCGSNYQKGEFLRSAIVDLKKNILPSTNFSGNKQIVRCSIYNEKENFLITGGEAGIISVWRPGDVSSSDITPTTSGLKDKSIKEEKRQKHKVKPY